jgi:Reverse transcriptase (RNA-dependent DNA polymerase)
MFLKAKYHPDGTFNKPKARLVACGYITTSPPPTVSTSAVFILAAVAAHERRHVTALDIGGAFLDADMGKDAQVYMRLDKTMSESLVTLDPSFSTFVDDRGGVTVKFQKALYECVESSGRWYENLRATMLSLGYQHNEMNVCVFNKRDKKGV